MPYCSNKVDVCKSFKILGSGIGYKGGRYIAVNKGVAAKRAGRKLFQKIDNNPEYKKFKNKTSIKFILGNTTRGEPNSTCAYIVSRTLLEKPISIVRNGISIEYKYDYTIEKLILPDNDPEIKSIMTKLD
jgi:hypothetical protein